MIIDGVKLSEGSSIRNLTVDAGTAFPSAPNAGEIFYRTDIPNVGTYVYNGSSWGAVAMGGTTGTVTSLSVVSANGISGVVANPTTTPSITLSLGSISPTAITTTGAVTAASFTGSGVGLTAIPNAALSNSSITIGTTPVSLGGSISSISGLASVTSTMFVGTLSGAATTAGTVTTAAQPAITSVGTLSSLAVSGAVTAASFSGSGAGLTNVPSGSLTNSSLTIGSTNITLGTTALSLAGLSTVTSTNFVGALTGNASTATLAASALSANTATTAGTVTTAAQPAITSVGTLTSLSVSGTINSNGKITVASPGAGLANLLLKGPLSDNNWGGVIDLQSNDLTTVNVKLQASTNGFIVAVAGTERMRLDAVGNLGLGVAPSIWGAGFKVIETPAGSFYGDSSTTTGTTQNAYFNVGWKYRGSGAASLHTQTGGSHSIWTAPGGVTNAAIPFTETVNISSIGLTVQTALSLSGPSTPIKLDGASGVSGQVLTSAGAGATPIWATPAVSAGSITIGSTNIALGATATTLAGLASVTSTSFVGALSGNATTATYLATNQQINVITGKSAGLGMALSDTTNLGSFVCRATGTGDSNLAGMTFHNDAYAIKLGVRADGYFGLGGYSRTAWSWYSDPSGNMVSAGNVSAYSDPRLKENIVPILGAIGILKQINGVRFDWRSGFQHTACKAGKSDIGILANEVEAVLPELITESIELEGESYKTVAYDKLIPVVIEAVKDMHHDVYAELDAVKQQLKEVQALLIEMRTLK